MRNLFNLKTWHNRHILLCHSHSHQQLLIINTNQDVKRELQALDTLASQRVDGIVNLTQNQGDTLLQKQLKLDIPQIIMGQPYQELSYVAFDDYQSGAQLTEAIAEKGHQKITYIGVDETDYAVGQLRKQGVLSIAIVNDTSFTRGHGH